MVSVFGILIKLFILAFAYVLWRSFQALELLKEREQLLKEIEI